MSFSPGERIAMKRVAVAIMLLLVALVLVACGGSSSSSESTGAAETSAEEAGGEEEAEGAGAEEEAEGGEEAGGGAAVKIAAAESGLAYSSDSASVEAGKVTIEFENPQPLGHDVAIETFNGEVLGQTEIITEGSDSTEIELKPGTYKFFCTVPGHRAAGMEGTLTVK
jgi:plastocyanin